MLYISFIFVPNIKPIHIIMEYIDARNGDIKETNYLRLVNGDSQFRVELDNQNRLVITKVDFNDDTINIQPMVRNQIAIK